MYGSAGGQAPANLGTEAGKELVALIVISGYVRTHADHEPNVGFIEVIDDLDSFLKDLWFLREVIFSEVSTSRISSS